MFNKDKDKREFLFTKSNYIYLIIGVVLNLIGFGLMVGGADTDPNEFNQNGLFSPIRLTVAPIVILLGYAVVIYSIMKKPEDLNKDNLPEINE